MPDVSILTRIPFLLTLNLIWSNELGESKMSGKTLSRRDLYEAVSRETGLPRSESAQLVERVLDLVSDALVEHKEVKISSFASFLARPTPGRGGRNPKTGEEIPIKPRYRLQFRPSHLMKDRVAARDCR